MIALATPIRAACAAALLSASMLPPALAAPSISWSFTPDFHQSGPSGTVGVQGTLLNTGTDTIVGINWLQAFYGSLGPYITNWTWNPTFWEDYNNSSGGGPLDIDPGESFSFDIATIDYANASPGLYTAVSNVTIGVRNAAGEFSGTVAPGNSLLVQIPEPSAAALVAAALLGLALTRRRRTADATRRGPCSGRHGEGKRGV